MTHEAIWAVLDAQGANAALSGVDLRRAATNLVAFAEDGHRVVMAFDRAGERILGAALLLSSNIRTFDYAGAFPSGAECLLVGGHIAGPVELEAAADAVRAAGATHVVAAFLTDWSDAVRNIEDCLRLDRVAARVA